MIGKTISHYRIIEKLGEGGMGVVYKAEDMKLRRTVALKFLPPDMMRDPDAKERFLHEAQAAAPLNHPSICTVYEVGEAEGLSFIVMQCIDGRSLRAELESGPLGLNRALEIGAELAEALSEAHAKGVIHRDIKPANIMITPSGRAKLMDFGLARLSGATLVTRTGTTLGTAAYMSPEQARGEPVDHRSDIWSLGVVLYEMISGTMPFRGEYAQAVMYSILNSDPAPLSSPSDSIPDGLENLVRKALAKNPDDRYQMAEDILRDLRALARGEQVTVTAPPRRRREKSTRPVRRWVPWAVAAAVVAVAVVGGRNLFSRSTPGDENVLPRVYVRVFENETGDSSRDDVGEEIAEHIVEGLSSVEILEVVPSTSVSSEARGAQFDYFVSGSYDIGSNGLEFRAEVGDVKRDRAVYVIRTAAVSAEDEANAIDRTRSRVMGGLCMEIQPPTYGYDRTRPPLYEAYAEQVLGQSAWGRGNIQEAIDRYERAAEIDSTFLPPLIALTFPFAGPPARADSVVQSLLARRDEWSPTENLWIDYRAADLRGDLRVMMRCLRELIVTDPGHAGIRSEAMHTALSLGRPQEAVEHFEALDYDRLAAEVGPLAKAEFVYWGVQAYHLLGEDDHALELARGAIEEFPESDGLRSMRIAVLAALGRRQELRAATDEWFQVATQVGMYSSVYSMHHVIGELRTHGYPEEARELAHRLVDWYEGQDATSPSVRGGKAIAFYCAEEWEQAAVILEQLASELPGNATVRGTLAAIAARRGYRDEALGILSALPQEEEGGVAADNTFWQARIAALLGEHQRCVNLLNAAIAQGAYIVPPQAHYHMDFEAVRDDPTFQAFLRPQS